MSVLLFLVLPLTILSFLPKNFTKAAFDEAVLGSKMEIAKDSSFSNKTLKFNGGDTIYVKVTTDNEGKNKHELNLRDDSYNLLSAYQMVRVNGSFLVDFAAPSVSGNYSLEAKIESDASVVSLVRTIEVGSSNFKNSNVKVKVDNQVAREGGFRGQIAESNGPDDIDLLIPDSLSEKEKEGKGFLVAFWAKVIGFFSTILKLGS